MLSLIRWWGEDGEDSRWSVCGDDVEGRVCNVDEGRRKNEEVDKVRRRPSTLLR